MGQCIKPDESKILKLIVGATREKPTVTLSDLCQIAPTAKQVSRSRPLGCQDELPYWTTDRISMILTAMALMEEGGVPESYKRMWFDRVLDRLEERIRTDDPATPLLNHTLKKLRKFEKRCSS